MTEAVVVQNELAEKALSWPEQARAIVIRDQHSYDLAASRLLDVAALRKEIVDHHKPMKEAAHEAHKRICESERKLLEPVAQAESILKGSIGAWDAEQRRIREDAERKAREEAERLMAEQIEAAAMEAEAAGASVEEVEAIVTAPVVVPKIAVQTYTKAAGISTAVLYSAEVTNLRELCRAVADGRVSEQCVQANTTVLNQMARALKTTMNIPGVRVVQTNSVRAGRR